MKQPTSKSIRLISLDESPRRGERVLGEWPEEDGEPKLLVAHWRREKRANNKEKKRQQQDNRGKIDRAAAFAASTGKPR